MGKYIGVILAIVASAAAQVKGWGSKTKGFGGPVYRPPTLRSQFSKNKGFKKNKRK